MSTNHEPRQSTTPDPDRARRDPPGAVTDRDRRRQLLEQERHELLMQVSSLLDRPMLVLAIAWVGLLILQYTSGLSTTLTEIMYAIWAVFVIHFVLEFIIAPNKKHYLEHNWLTAVSLVLPAFRMLAFVRVFSIVTAHAAGSVAILRAITSLNRGLRATREGLGHRGIGSVVAFTVLVLFAGAAVMYQFENTTALRAAGLGSVVAQGGGITSYGSAVWFTGMILTTIGSSYFPVTAGGRVMCLLLAIYGLSVLGYITASVASFFVGQAQLPGQQPAPQPAAPDLTKELASLREQIARLSEQLEAGRM